MRSSPEWKEMTPSLPPAASRAGASSRAWRRAPGSSLTAMRRAWKVRVATWMRVDQARRGTARLTAATRSPVVASGRRWTIARAIRRACGSSPYSKSMRASSRSGSRFTSVAAVSPRVGSRRMSSGSAARRKEKPRADSSSWYDDTPRSRRIARARVMPCAAAARARLRKLSCARRTRPPKGARRAPARASASPSTSSPSRRTSDALDARSASACPPIPTVPSIIHPPPRGRRRNATSSASTGT